MGMMLDLTFYNPNSLKDDDFLRGFGARREMANRILQRLGEITSGSVAQHRLIIGQRGMGKTSLLRRIAIGVRETPQLSKVLIPLTFREEQYNVHRLHVLWCNFLDALGDYFEATGQRDKAEEIDREVADLDMQPDDDEGTAALAVFRKWLKSEGKRPLLLLDNIDLIFDGLKAKQWSLRRILQEAGGMIVIGASAAFLEAVSIPEAAFYEFFQVDVLEKLSHEEIRTCLRQLALERGESGKKVLDVLGQDPARIHVLYDLTGGNPRTLVMLYLMLEMSDDGDLLRDLERLLDQATPLYKARVEEFAPQARVVFDAVALQWNPVSAADVASASGLDVGAVSAQLNRLERDGIIEKTSLSSTVRTGFQVSERFFNIWYLMRHAPRRQKNRLRWLTEFLRGFYTPPQLLEAACRVMKRTDSGDLTQSMYCLALSEVIEDRVMERALRFEADRSLKEYASQMGVSLDSLVDISQLENPSTSFDWFLLGYICHVKVGSYDRAEEAYRKAIELDPKFVAPWDNLGNLLKDNLYRYEESEAAYKKAIELDPKRPYSWNNLGILLTVHLCRYDEAQAAYRKAIELDPKDAKPWNNLGNLLFDFFGNLQEAEVAYKKCRMEDALSTNGLIHLAYLLLSQPERRQEGEECYKEALTGLPEANAGFLRTFHALVSDNFGLATSELKTVLEEGHEGMFSCYHVYLQRVLWMAKSTGYGEKLLEWLQETGLKDRYWPLYTAFDAYIYGEARLKDVNPEVRGVAQQIYKALARRPKIQRPILPQEAPKKKRHIRK